MSTIRDRFLCVYEKIFNTCIKYGRDPNSIKLVVVTKKQPVEKILQLLQAGASILGENYPEEIQGKRLMIPDEFVFQWHMIGHIQSRKIKYVVKFCDFVHSIDSLDLGLKLDQACVTAKTTIPAFIEINISGEQSKQGFNLQNSEGKSLFFRNFDKLLQSQGIQLIGLMTMPPYSKVAEDSRQVFRTCRVLLEEIQAEFKLTSFTQLSMGTSQDFEVAIQEGATYLRIGEAIMGERTSV